MQMDAHQMSDSSTIPHHFVKVMNGSSTSYTRIIDPNELQYLHTRPMLVSTWTQTSDTDFSLLTEEEQQSQNVKTLQQQHENKTVRYLMDKIKVLEESLKAHSELLSEIQTTRRSNVISSRSMIHNDNEEPLHTMATAASSCLPIKPDQPIQSNSRNTSTFGQRQHIIHNQQSTSEKPIQQKHQRLSSSSESLKSVVPLSIQPAVINPLQQVQNSNGNSQSIKYTIVTSNEDSSGPTSEPIEIQISTDNDDDAVNLNCSTDSNRLEICLNEEPQQERFINTSAEGNVSGSIATPVIKRRRVDVKSEVIATEDHAQVNYFYIDNAGVPINKSLLSESNSNINNNLPSFHSIGSSNQRLSLPVKTELREANKQQVKLNNSFAGQPTSSSNTSLSQKMNIDNILVSLGPNNTRIPAKVYESMNWSSASIATRKLLMVLFDRNILATHSMTGKPSPAFKNHGKPLKGMLDKNIVQDIIYAVTHRCNATEKEVRNAITTKCADENKMMKLKMNKNASNENLANKHKEFNKENAH